MPQYRSRVHVPVPASELFAWHARPGAFERLTPPWQPVRVERHDGIAPGDLAVFRMGPGPGVRWVARHEGTSDACRTSDAPCQFVDVQEEGPFASWRHTHRMLPDGPGASILDDDLAFSLPLGPLADAVGGPVAVRQLERVFGYRHRVTREDLTRHAAAGLPPQTVVMTGASGLVGRALAAFLTTGGHRVVRLVRTREAAAKADALYWDPAAGALDAAGLARVAPDAVVHLAGEPVFGVAYTAAKKRAIWESRTAGTRLLARALAALPTPPRAVLSASASGYYGPDADGDVTERSPQGTGFLAAVCGAWEAATHEAAAAGIRTVQMRIGLVLSPQGGLLQNVARAVQVGLGASPGRGAWPWIALDDVLYAVLHLLASDLQGPVNLSAPHPVPADEAVRTLAHVLGRPSWGAAPAALVHALGGEMARELLTSDIRMLPDRLSASGFSFAYPTLEGALRHVLGRTPSAPSA